jgi:predicted component of type VI protein secretion system
MPRLSILLEGSKTIHELTDDHITIGRAPDNMIRIDDPSVSGRHAQLLLIDDRYQLKDLDSTNGTRVNNDSVTDVFLCVGDRIRFGNVEARYESHATGEAQPSPEVGEIEALTETSERPADFTNASPFPNRRTEKDPAATAILAVAALAILAFLVTMLGLFQIHDPL